MAFLLLFSTARRKIDQSLHRRRAQESVSENLRQHPAFFYAISILIGTSAPLFCPHFIWPILWCLVLLWLRAFAQIFLLIAAIFYAHLHILPPPPAHEISAIFSPKCLQTHQSPFQKGLVYKGSLFTPTHDFPCSIYYRGTLETHPLADKQYLVHGLLHQRGPTDFVFKTKTWTPIKNTWSLAELRYQTKTVFKKLLSEHLSSSKAALFLSSITTGDVEDRMIRYEFGRLGLQHILAISGFHFGLLIAFCSFCLQRFLPRNQKIIVLFLAVNAYFLFVGSSPAIQRSWLTALFYLLGSWLNRETSGLNLLGCALCIELLLDPLISIQIGFQLSFLSCAGILLFYPFFEKKLQNLFPKRSWTDIISLSTFSQTGYLLSSFFRQGLSLTLSVNLLLFPLLLFHFHQFPLLSLLYNLFFPFLVGVALFLLLFALIFHLLFPPIASYLYLVTDRFTTLLLDLTAYPPLPLDFCLRVSNISGSLVIAYLFLILLIFFSSKENP